MVIFLETGIRTCDIYRHLPLLLNYPIPNNLRMQRQVCVGLYPGGETNGFPTAALTQLGFLFFAQMLSEE